MKAVTLKELKAELSHCSNAELIELLLRLSKFKKENKELLSYLLFESSNEEGYISRIKAEMDEQFDMVNTKNYQFIKKGIRKILHWLKVQIRYSKNKETEVELLLHFCIKMNDFNPSILTLHPVIQNIYNREINAVKKKILLLHEDLQYDFNVELTKIMEK
jgi:hypothetical protein